MMRSDWCGRRAVLKGYVSISRLESLMGALLKLIAQGNEDLCLKTNEERKITMIDDEDVLAELILLLKEFEDLFTELHGLPPKRERHHAIRLVEGAQPPNLRPYRYPYFQKNEVERIIKEMLTARIIRSNVSPHSSPVLLVRKKDES